MRRTYQELKPGGHEVVKRDGPEAHYLCKDANAPGPRIDPESVAAWDILEPRLGPLVEGERA